MKKFDINSFLDVSFKRYSECHLKEKKSSKPIQTINASEKSATNSLFNNLIDTQIYDKLNLASLNDNIPLENIIKPLFPNDKVYSNECTSDKAFILEKFIKPKVEKLKHLKKTNYSKNLVQTLKKSKMSFDSLQPLTILWAEYFTSLMNNSITPEIIGDKLLKADLHGSLLEVISSINKNTIGIKGIVLLETKKTFNLLCTDNCIRTLLKQGTIFKINLPNGKISFNLIGNNFLFRTTERTKIKFKTHYCLNKDLFSIYTNFR